MCGLDVADAANFFNFGMYSREIIDALADLRIINVGIVFDPILRGATHISSRKAA